VAKKKKNLAGCAIFKEIDIWTQASNTVYGRLVRAEIKFQQFLE
jgi:hypothetical protein